MLGTYTPPVAHDDQAETLAAKVTKDPTNGNAVNGGTCDTLVGLLHPKAIVAKLSGVSTCLATADSGAYPLNGKFSYTMTETTINPKTGLPMPYSIQAYVRIAGVEPSAADVIDIKGMVIKGVGVGSTVRGSLYEDAATKNLKTDPSTHTGYHLDAAKDAACQAGTGTVDIVLLGDGPSALGGNATGLSFTFGE